MNNDNNERERLKHNDTGGHLGGTKFGQEPGTNGPNPAKPDEKNGNAEQNQSDKPSSDDRSH